MSEKYNVSDFVVYDVYGVCKILKIENLSFLSGTPKQSYYILSPLNSSASTYYVPTEGQTATQKLRSPMTEDEIHNLLLTTKNTVLYWIDKRQERNDTSNRILSSGITPELVSLVSCLYNRKNQISETGKKLTSSDESIFSQAEKIIKKEFSFSPGIPDTKVSEHIHTFIENNN